MTEKNLSPFRKIAEELRALIMPGKPRADVTLSLGVPEDAEVIVRRRAFFVHDEPMQLVDGYYPADLFAVPGAFRAYHRRVTSASAGDCSSVRLSAARHCHTATTPRP